MNSPEIKILGYLKTTRLDREGAKDMTFQFSAKETLKTAKVELMSRDFGNHLPMLLEVKIRVADEKKQKRKKEKGRKALKKRYDFT